MTDRSGEEEGKVWCCRECHSLRVVDCDPCGGYDCYCGACGSTDVALVPFEEWLREERRLRFGCGGGR